ncbi:hypothetical protein [Hymenobacter terricola]|uniref:hypothetical protein n=1 Tax=Hymenobacter terricola TaxID=2819236 RepID=UPI001B303951|nr:hypothetical protein [Hymenobacter terricola]
MALSRASERSVAVYVRNKGYVPLRVSCGLPLAPDRDTAWWRGQRPGAGEHEPRGSYLVRAVVRRVQVPPGADPLLGLYEPLLVLAPMDTVYWNPNPHWGMAGAAVESSQHRAWERRYAQWRARTPGADGPPAQNWRHMSAGRLVGPDSARVTLFVRPDSTLLVGWRTQPGPAFAEVPETGPGAEYSLPPLQVQGPAALRPTLVRPAEWLRAAATASPTHSSCHVHYFDYY